jgi:hypothetical protein
MSEDAWRPQPMQDWSRPPPCWGTGGRDLRLLGWGPLRPQHNLASIFDGRI